MERWKILIADDEPKIRRGLHAQIDRLGLPCEVCAEAEDGEIALEAAERLRPDILLVDINMPFVNGLDFIQALRRTRADARVILITGYEEFEYARRALELDVHAYLLKPIDVGELRRAVETAIDQLEVSRQRNRHFEWAIAQIGNRREFLREEFLRDAVSGRLEADEIREFRVYFDFPEPERMMLMLISAHSSAAGEKPWQHTLRQYALQDALREGPEGMRYRCLFSDDRGNVLLLYDAPPELDARLTEAVRAALGGELGLTVRLETEPVASLTRIAEAYDSAMERMLSSAQLSPIVDGAKAYIAAHYADPDLSLMEVAEALNAHPAYLSRTMKQELGMPFAKYLTNVRIGKAVQLMRDPSIRIWKVAEMVGYSGGNYFSAAFKKVLGVSPADYRMEDKRK